MTNISWPADTNGTTETSNSSAVGVSALSGLVRGWMPIETAPKSKVDGARIHGIYILGFCPEPDMCNLESAICVVWWEPLMNGGNGMWYGEGGYETHPTHWMPLPKAPNAEVSGPLSGSA